MKKVVRFGEHFTVFESQDQPQLSEEGLKELSLALEQSWGTEGWGFFPSDVKKAIVASRLTWPLIRDKFRKYPGKTPTGVEGAWEALNFLQREVQDISPFRDLPPDE